MPVTGLLRYGLFECAKIYLLLVLNVFPVVMLRRADWTPFFTPYTLISSDYISPVVASLDADFGCAIQRDRGTGEWNLKKICHVHVTSFLILRRPPPLGGGFVAFRYLL